MKNTHPTGADPLGAECPRTEMPTRICAHCALGATPGHRSATFTPEQEILIMSARKAPDLDLDAKMDRVFAALANGTKLTKRQLIAATEMSAIQVTEGWRGLRGQPDGAMWVMEPHREHTLYYAAAEAEPMLRYQLWQARRNYRANVALFASTEQITAHIESIRPENGLRKATRTAREAVRDSLWGYKSLIRHLADELRIDEETVEKWLAMPSVA